MNKSKNGLDGVAAKQGLLFFCFCAAAMMMNASVAHAQSAEANVIRAVASWQADAIEQAALKEFGNQFVDDAFVKQFFPNTASAVVGGVPVDGKQLIPTLVFFFEMDIKDLRNVAKCFDDLDAKPMDDMLQAIELLGMFRDEGLTPTEFLVKAAICPEKIKKDYVGAVAEKAIDGSDQKVKTVETVKEFNSKHFNDALIAIRSAVAQKGGDAAASAIKAENDLRIKAKQTFRSLLKVSNKIERETLRRAIETMYDDYLKKPCEPDNPTLYQIAILYFAYPKE